MTRSPRKYAARRGLLAALLLLAPLALAAQAAAATGLAPARGFAPREVVVKFAGDPHGRAVRLPAGVSVRGASAALERNPRVVYAAPNFIARASATVTALASARRAAAPFDGVPNDPGPINGPPGPTGGWVQRQWNFLPWQGTGTAALPISPGGINAVAAWNSLIDINRPGAQGIRVAVLDTGVAYRDKGTRYRRSPDFTAGQFAGGFDFVDNDRLPLDDNGHGTHVTATIGEKTNNGVGLTGLAYRAKLIPVRVLDRNGSGRADDIAAGIRYAVANRADVINMSFNFACRKRLPGINEELRRAYEAGIVTVASIGNLGSESCVSPPATGPHVIGVGGTTQGGCLGSYSLSGKGVDVLAPGGGTPTAGCPSVLAGPIFQVTLKGSPSEFGEPGGFAGTSMAAAHVSGVAAMVLASAVLPPSKKDKRRVRMVAKRLAQTARSLGLPRVAEGGGLIDAGRATDRSCQRACLLGSP
jgi:serine protease